MESDAIPSEEAQFEAYKKVAETLDGKPVIIRTLDIGGDKALPYLGLPTEENPFLGFRAVRFCLQRKEDIYKPQLRACICDLSCINGIQDRLKICSSTGNKNTNL